MTEQSNPQARPGNRNAEGSPANPAPKTPPLRPAVARLRYSFGSYSTWRGFAVGGDTAKHGLTGGTVSAPLDADGATPYRARVDGKTTFHKTPEGARDAIHAALRRRDEVWRRKVAANPMLDPRNRRGMTTALENR